MTYTAGFNDGIEAAALLMRVRCAQWTDPKISERYADAARDIEALKRPEPSEDLRVEKVAAAIERELMVVETLLADPTALRKIKSQRIARAALKAMEQQEQEV